MDRDTHYTYWGRVRTDTHYTYWGRVRTQTHTTLTEVGYGHRHTLHILRQQGHFISLLSFLKKRKVSQMCNYSRVSLIVINWNGQNHHKNGVHFQCKMFVCFKNLRKARHKNMKYPQEAQKAGKIFLTKLQTFFGIVKYIRWLKVRLQDSTRAINLTSCREINWAERDLHNSMRMEKINLSAIMWSLRICQNCSQKVNIPNTETLLYSIACTCRHYYCC